MHAYSSKLLIQLIKKVCYIELNCLSFSYFVYMMYVSGSGSEYYLGKDSYPIKFPAFVSHIPSFV